MKIILNIWRQQNATSAGKMVRYEMPNVSEHMSFLEMIDVLNEELTKRARIRSRSSTTAARASAAAAVS